MEEVAPGILQNILEEGTMAIGIYWWWQHTEQIPNHKTPTAASSADWYKTETVCNPVCDHEAWNLGPTTTVTMQQKPKFTGFLIKRN